VNQLSYTERRERFLASPFVKLLLERGEEEKVEKLWTLEEVEVERQSRPPRP
jgi:hypothetical protein